jgi:serine/threonine protein kinase
MLSKGRTSALHSIESEIQVLEQLNHVNIVSLFEVMENEKKMYLVMELASRGSINANLPLCEEKAHGYFQQFA